MCVCVCVSVCVCVCVCVFCCSSLCLHMRGQIFVYMHKLLFGYFDVCNCVNVRVGNWCVADGCSGLPVIMQILVCCDSLPR